MADRAVPAREVAEVLVEAIARGVGDVGVRSALTSLLVQEDAIQAVVVELRERYWQMFEDGRR